VNPIPPALVLSPEDRARVDEVEELARSGAAGGPALLALLTDPSWAVRRAVVAALANLGEPVVEGLCEVLQKHRDSEPRLAAAVDALVASRADVDAPLMALAQGENLPVVCDAVQVLGRRRCRAAVPLLSELAAHADDNVSVGAIEALGRIGGVETVDPLIAAVEGHHFFRTFPAVDALGRTGDARAVRPLRGLLSDPLYATEAARALGRTGQESAVAPLAELLVKPTDSLVRTAATALAELRERYEARFGDNPAMARALPEATDAALASSRIVQTMQGVGPSESASIARVLGWLGHPIGMTHLIAMVMEDDPVATAASGALRRLGRRAIPHLLAAIRSGDSTKRLRVLPLVGYAEDSIDDLLVCLEDPEADVRVRACEALARLGNPSAVNALFRLIGDRDARVSQAAAAAIQSLGSLETKRLALEQARSNDTRTRRAALRIISYFGYPEGLEILIGAIDEEDEKIREAAIYGIPLIDDPKGTAALLEAASHASTRTRAAVMRALGQTEAQPAVVETLGRGLGDDDPWVRYYACQALGRLKVEKATEAIVRLMRDESGQVRVAAVEALAHLQAEEAGQALAEAARSEDPDMRRAALLGLGIARRLESLPLLREAASAEDTATRLVAIGAIAELESHDVVPVLAHAATDPDEAVRSAAIGYLSTRPGADATKALIEGLSNPLVRERIFEALAVAADERVEAVLTALEGADAEHAPVLVFALLRMRRPSSQAALAAALTQDNVHARRAAASALAALGTQQAREALARAGSVDPDVEVRRLCAAVATT
jgi:HEAT repeat protein